MPKHDPNEVEIMVKKDNLVVTYLAERAVDMSALITKTKPSMSFAIPSGCTPDVNVVTKRERYYAYADLPYTIRWFSLAEWDKTATTEAQNDGQKKRDVPIGYFQVVKDRRVVDMIADRKIMMNVLGQEMQLSKMMLVGILATGSIIWIVIRIAAKALGVVLP